MRAHRRSKPSRFAQATLCVKVSLARASRHVLDRTDLTDPDLFLSLGSLSDAERVAVVMVHAHRATYQEVADLLDVPITTVNNLVHRGLNRLRAALEEA